LDAIVGKKIYNMKKFRVPRKLKKKIPQGMYCYEGLNFDCATGIYNIRSCRFYNYIKRSDKSESKKDEIDKEYPDEYCGYCRLIKSELIDQCKSCGIKKI
jgi:hypothetical protein